MPSSQKGLATTNFILSPLHSYQCNRSFPHHFYPPLYQKTLTIKTTDGVARTCPWNSIPILSVLMRMLAKIPRMKYLLSTISLVFILDQWMIPIGLRRICGTKQTNNARLIRLRNKRAILNHHSPLEAWESTGLRDRNNIAWQLLRNTFANANRAYNHTMMVSSLNDL